MNPTVRRLAALAALGTTVGVLAPVASASAATMPAVPPGFAFPHSPVTGLHLPTTGLNLPTTGLNLPPTGLGNFPVAGLPDFTPAPLSFAGPAIGQVAAVIGPTVITSAPSTFTNTNIQVSAGGNGTGGQAAP